MSNWCCHTWKDLAAELAAFKMKEVQQLKEKGVPSSVFSTLVAVIDGCGNYCPVCGKTNIKTKTFEDVTTREPEIKVESVKCNNCKGTGKIGGEILCGVCLGSGKVEKRTPVNLVNTLAKIEALQEQVRKKQQTESE